MGTIAFTYYKTMVWYGKAVGIILCKFKINRKNKLFNGGQKLKVKFLENVNISNQITLLKGEEFKAKEDGDFIMIRMEDESIVKAPKTEIEGVLEVLK